MLVRADVERGAGLGVGEYPRVAALGADCVLSPTAQPWGTRSMILRDPAGNLVNVFSR